MTTDSDAALTEELLNGAAALLQDGKPEKALEVLLPLAQSMRHMDEEGLFITEEGERFYDLDTTLQSIQVVMAKQPIGDLVMAPLPIAQTYYVCAAALYDLGRYDEAIAWLERGSEYNPAQARFYFEIAENYKRIGDIEMVAEWLDKAHPFITNAANLACWYRGQGFCATEREEYKLAAALFLVSMFYESSEMAISELVYLESVGNVEAKELTPEDTFELLESAGIAIGPSESAIEALATTARLAQDNGDDETAIACARDIFDLTGDEEALTSLGYDPADFGDGQAEVGDTTETEIDGVKLTFSGHYAPVELLEEDEDEYQIGFAALNGATNSVLLMSSLNIGLTMLGETKEQIISALHEELSDCEGIIEVACGTTQSERQYAYTITKCMMDPAGTEYNVCLDIANGKNALRIQGLFEEWEAFGLRESAVLALEGQEEPDDCWACDPYDPTFTSGYLMTKAEAEEYDEMFELYPLTRARRVVREILDNLN